jgi:hypothetical protein
VPLRLGVCEVTAQVGEGGMGQVYRARDMKLNRDVALKVLPDSVACEPAPPPPPKEASITIGQITCYKIGQIIS